MHNKGGQETFSIISRARSRISFAALLVKVSVKVLDAGIPKTSIRYTKRDTIVVVLPLPAPAKIRIGPSECLVAILCASFKFLNIFFIFLSHSYKSFINLFIL